MNDRLPGSCWDNPIWYKGYRIYLGDGWPAHEYDYCHDDYDGAEDAGDNRCGGASTIEACKMEIDELEDA